MTVRSLLSGLVGAVTDPVLHQSGLAVVSAAANAQDGPVPVIWTSGEPNRHLHMLFAHEEPHVRVFCGKAEVSTLVTAVRHAAAGEQYIDPELSYYVPNSHGRRLRETILSQPRKLALWRATALGEHQHGVLARLTGLSAKAVRTGMGGDAEQTGRVRSRDGHRERPVQ